MSTNIAVAILKLAGTPSDNAGNKIENLIDASPDTRYSSQDGVINATLNGGEFNAIDLRFFKGDTRKTKFQVLAGNELVGEFESNGTTLDTQRFVLKGKSKATELSIKFLSNSDNSKWLSISDFKIALTTDAPTDHCDCKCPCCVEPNPKPEPKPDPKPDPDPKPEPKPDPNPTPAGQVGPYPQKAGTKNLESTQRGPTTRHYASGKPDDETIEKNVKNIAARNYQFIVETTINQMEHDDNLSLKFGGQHTSGRGWWDTGVGIYDGKTCLGTEPDHPETHLCLVKGPKIGDIRGKKIKVAGVFFQKNNHIELWTNVDGKTWIKQVEGDAVGKLNPDHTKNHECQQRIDGFKKGSIPTLHLAIVQEIEPKA